MSSVKELTRKYKDYTVSLRREFHMHPEPSMEEVETSRKIMEELKKLGIDCYQVAGTGVVGVIKGKEEGKTIALRADMDALELEEENDVEYKSQKKGLMHGCGHDGHMASLLTAGRILNDMKDEFAGTVKLFFQPGEEVAQGAKAMVKEGVLEGVDGIFGIHLWNELDTGLVSVEAGPRMASVGKFTINVTGKGGHGSMPHQGVDAIVVGSAIVMNLQSVVSREISPMEPAVLSVGKFNSGSRFNVMPGEAYLEGTTRCYSMEVNDMFPEVIERIAGETAKSYRAKAEVEYATLTLPTINDPRMSATGEEVVRKMLGDESLVKYEKTTGGEDFSFFAAEVPAAFAFVGSRNEDRVDYYPHHHPKFDIDEDALEISAGLYAGYALEFLSK